MEYSFTIPGKPEGKRRHRAVKRGKHVATYNPEENLSYEGKVRECLFRCYRDVEMSLNPMSMTITACFGVPKASKKKTEQMLANHIRPTKKPDLDNICKIIMDALNNIIYKDDSQIVDLHVQKFYSSQSFVKVNIKEVE